MVWLLAGLVALLGVLTVQITSAANSAAVVRPDPLSVGLREGEQTSVSIRVENVTDLYGIEFHLRFDPKVVKVQDADPSKEGVQVATGNWFKDGFVAVNKVDNAKGTIDFAVTLLNPADPVNGDGTVGTIEFHAAGQGTSPLTLKATLASRDAAVIKAEVKSGAVGVSLLGQAPEVKPVNNEPRAPVSGGSAPASPTLSTTTLLLIGVAGVGVLGFFGAMGLVALLLVFRRR